MILDDWMDWLVKLNIVDSWNGVIMLVLITYVAVEVRGIRKSIVDFVRDNRRRNKELLKKMGVEDID